MHGPSSLSCAGCATLKATRSSGFATANFGRENYSDVLTCQLTLNLAVELLHLLLDLPLAPLHLRVELVANARFTGRVRLQDPGFL